MPCGRLDARKPLSLRAAELSALAPIRHPFMDRPRSGIDGSRLRRRECQVRADSLDLWSFARYPTAPESKPSS